LATLLGMILNGYFNIEQMSPSPAVTVLNLFTYANSVQALLWSSFAGCVVAFVLMTPFGYLSLSEFMEAWMTGVKDVLEPIIVLLLAWALGDVISDLQTANFLVHLISGKFPVSLFPFLVTLLSFTVSFATGTTFGSMGILFPLVVPLSYELGHHDEQQLLIASSAVFGGVIFGNHCSPLADNTVLTSAATGCDINSHVSTTLPYALAIATITLFCGYLPLGFHVPIWIVWPVCLVSLLVMLFVLGKPSNGSAILHQE